MVAEFCQHGRRFRPSDLADGGGGARLHALGQRIDGLDIVNKDVCHAKPGCACRIIVEVYTALLSGKRLWQGIGVKREMKVVVALIRQANRARGAGGRVVSDGVDAACVQIRFHPVG